VIRALIVESSGELWGSERALLDLIQATPHLEVAVCCPPQSRLEDELKRRGVRVLPYFIAGLHQKSRRRRFHAAVGVLRACLSFRPDVIHLNQSGAYRVTLPAAMILGLPIVGHVRIFEDATYLAQQRPDSRRLKGIVAISGAIENEVRGFNSLSAVPVHRIYDPYVSVPSETGAIKRERGRIACVGRITPIKGQEVLLDAVALADALPEDAECLIVGDGEAEYIERLKAKMRGKGQGRIQWSGFVERVDPLLRSCAVLACPSHREPLGRVIFEAWDAGAVPVVYAGAGGSAEIVSAADGGIVYGDQTPECLARALSAAIRLDDREAERFVENGRAWMAAHCSPGPCGSAFSAVLAGASQRMTHGGAPSTATRTSP
jgi:glycosyltransferase involved in cell wall biosynthesis